MRLSLYVLTMLLLVSTANSPTHAAETSTPVKPDVNESAAEIASKGDLSKRLKVVDVPVDVEINVGQGIDNPSSFYNGRALRPVMYAPQPNGGAKIGWTDVAGKIHITPVDKNAKRAGDDVTIDTGKLRDLVAHDDGSAALVLRNGGMYLHRIKNGESVFQIRLISNWCRDIHWGSLAFNGEKYCAYFAIHGGGHEGDALRYISPEGKILNGGWNWGVSHSIDMRLAVADKKFMPLALSDAYPGTGIYFNHNQKRVTYVWGDRAGNTGGRIGGMVPVGDKMFVAFTSKQGGRQHWTAALADFTQKPPHKQSVHKYLRDSDSDQVNVKLARYGKDRLLVSWLEKDSSDRKFQMYDSSAKPIGGLETLPVRASARADLKTLNNGDVIWAHTWGDDKKKLKVVRIRKP